MTIRQWKVYRAVVDCGSMTRAGQQLYMSQPAVSHVVADLEKELGYPLLDRIGHQWTVNERGWQLYHKIVQVLESIEDLESSAEQIERQALLRIGSSITIANAWLPSQIRAFQKQCPLTPLKVTVDSAANIAEQLRRNEIDIGFVEGALKQDSLIFLPFSSYSLAVVCAADNPIAEDVCLSEALKQPWLLREKGSAVRDSLDSALRLRQICLDPFWVSVNTQALIRAAEAGLGLAVVPELAAAEALQQKTLKALTLKELRLINENQMILHRDKFQSEAIRWWIELVRKEGEHHHE